MSQRRVCDTCSIRRVKCDGADPCAACLKNQLDCTRLRPRVKSGPKGVRKKTLEKLKTAKRQYAADSSHLRRTSNDHLIPETNLFNIGAERNDDLQFWLSGTPGEGLAATPMLQDDSPQPAVDNGYSVYESVAAHSSIPVQDEMASSHMWPFLLPVGALKPYLEIYHHKLYSVWPIVQTDALVATLENGPPDFEAYMLASSVCAATILQLQLVASAIDSSILEPRSMLAEIEDLRHTHGYRERPSLDQLSTSFFLHVAYLHLGRRTTSTLLLREAVSIAHMLGLNKSNHYNELSVFEAQDHLRRLWLLFITEETHATQYDIPCITNMEPCIPALNDNFAPTNPPAFILLCKMFTFYHDVASERSHTARTLKSLHNQLQQVPTLDQYSNDIQRADLSITQQWMRLIFWKRAVAQIRMSAEQREDIQSVLFPVYIAKDLLTHLSGFSVDTLEAHGPGMELKLFEFVNAVTDVTLCVPRVAQQQFEFGPRDFLVYLAGILGNFRGGNNALLPILQSRLADVGLDVPSIPRIVDVTHESTDSQRSRFMAESDFAF